MTRSGYIANNIKPTAPSIKSLGATSSDTTNSSKNETSNSSKNEASSSNISVKTLDRTIPVELFSMSTNTSPLRNLLPISIQGKQFYGLADTGASSSCLDPLIPVMFNLKISPEQGRVKLADVTLVSNRLGTCDITAEITIPDTNTKVSFDHTFEIVPIFDRDNGYHFIIGRDILGPLFHQGLSSSLFTPDPHVKLPIFHDSSLAAIVSSMRSNNDSIINSSSTNNISSVNLNRIDISSNTVFMNEIQISTINDELKTLANDIHNSGAGSVPEYETPIRPSLLSENNSFTTVISDSASTSFDLSSTTPDAIQEKYSEKLNTLLVLLSANEAITGFCSLPGSQVELFIDESKKHLLYRRQYPIAQTLWSLADQVITRWFDTGKIVLAPVGCEFNLPLTIAPKKDDNGLLTGIRVCLDTRILNDILLSTDKFLIPQIRDTISMFSNCSLFGEFDLSEAYLQFPLHPNSHNTLHLHGIICNICLQVFHLVLILFLLIFNDNYLIYFMIYHLLCHI